jgi:predicted nuclease of restriction endonuclease-like (RecB) superfamily
MTKELALPKGYEDFLKNLKNRIRQSQIRASFAVSHELITLYWQIGKDLVEAQKQHNWGDNVLGRIASDIKAAFPGVEGFSRRNLYRMRQFYLAYSKDSEFVPQAVAQIPWGHNAVLLEKVKDLNECFWYAQQTLENGWSRPILELQIQSKLYQRQGKALTNFAATLPPPQSDLAQQILKDPYHFDVRHVAVYRIPDAVRRTLGRTCLNRPTYPYLKGDGNHSMLVKRWLERRCQNQRAARFAKQGESYIARTLVPIGTKVFPSEGQLIPRLAFWVFKSNTLRPSNVQGDR